MPITKEMLEKRAAAVRTGGKGSMRRTVKTVVKAPAANEDKKVQGTLKKLGVSPINDIDEAIFLRTDGTASIFNKPKVQASMQSQCFVVTGPHQTKSLQEMLPAMMGNAGMKA